MLFSVSQFCFSFLDFYNEVISLLLGQNFLCEHEGPETIHGKVLARLKQRCFGPSLDLLLNHNFSAFEVVDVPASVLGSEQTAHLLGFTGEWEAPQDFEFFDVALDVLHGAVCSFTFEELHPEQIAKLDESDLIRTRGLKLWFSLLSVLNHAQSARIALTSLLVNTVLNWLRFCYRCHIVAHCECCNHISQYF